MTLFTSGICSQYESINRVCMDLYARSQDIKTHPLDVPTKVYTTHSRIKNQVVSLISSRYLPAKLRMYYVLRSVTAPTKPMSC